MHIGAFDLSVALHVLKILGKSKALIDRPLSALDEQLLVILLLERFSFVPFTHAGRDQLKDFGEQGSFCFFCQIGKADRHDRKPHSAVDVIADAAGTDHPFSASMAAMPPMGNP